MPKLKQPTTRPWLAALAFPLLAGTASLASAAKLAPPKQVSNPIVSPTVVANGQLKTSAPVLGSRSSKPSGGYVLNPVCVTSDAVIVGTVQYQASKWRVVCPDGGKAILNGSDYTTEDKLTVVQRGGLSPATVVLQFPGGNGVAPFTRALCYGKLSNGQTLPGVMSVTPRQTVPTDCKVNIMGNWIALTDWGVFKHANSGLVSGDHWWSPGADASPSTTELPLYTWSPPGRDALCRAKDPSSGLTLPGEVVTTSTSRKCRILNNGWQTVSEFEVYVAPSQASRPVVSTVAKPKANQSWSTGVLVHDGGSDATRVYACIVPGTQRIGWVKKSDGVCRSGNETATSFKLLIK